MDESRWNAVDEYVNGLLVQEDDALHEAVRASEAAGLPPIAVSPAHGKFLYLLARVQRATRILEIGTLGGYSTIWLARGLAPNGRVTTLELHPKHADVAVFIDADKPSTPSYFEWAVRLSRPGTLILLDNVVRRGALADADTDDESARAMQRLNELVSAESRVSATLIQTVGVKGYDGFMIALREP